VVVLPSAIFPQRGVMPAGRATTTPVAFAGAAVADNANVANCPW